MDVPVNECWNVFANTLNSIMASCIPKIKKNNRTKNKPLWMTKQAQDKIKAKQKAFTNFKTTMEQSDYSLYTRARNQAKWATRKAVQDFEKNIAREAKSNPKAFFKYAKSKLKSRPGIPDLKREDGGVACSNIDKAEALNHFFSSVFTRETEDNLPSCDFPPVETALTDTLFTEIDIAAKLHRLKIDKSAGPDGIHPRVLKEMSASLNRPLYILFRCSLDNGKIPTAWRDAHVSPIFKKGSKCNPGNYRPVSLT